MVFFYVKRGQLFSCDISSIAAETGKPADATQSALVRTLPPAAAHVTVVGSKADRIYCTIGDKLHEVTIDRPDGGAPIATFPSACCQLQSLGNKVYALCGDRLVSYDPLSRNTEVFALQTAASTFCPLTNRGFVFASAEKQQLFLFTFEGGCASVRMPTDAPYAAKILTEVNRQVLCVVEASGARHLMGVDQFGSARLAAQQPIAWDEAIATEPCSCVPCGSLGFVAIARSTGALVVGSLKNTALLHELVPAVDQCQAVVTSPDTAIVDSCSICMCEFEEGSDEQAITLDCGHAFHVECLEMCMNRAENYLAKGQHIVFNMAKCPSGCGRLLRHPIFPKSEHIAKRYRMVQEAALKRAVAEYPDDNPDEVIERFLFYLCAKCQKPFWGGNKDCVEAQTGEPTNDPAKLLCEDCTDEFRCPTHGREFVVYRCDTCCNPATDLSWGTRRRCARCVAERVKEPIACKGGAHCPCFGVPHVAGEKTVLGCLACEPLSSALKYEHIVPAPVKKAEQKK